MRYYVSKTCKFHMSNKNRHLNGRLVGGRVSLHGGRVGVVMKNCALTLNTSLQKHDIQQNYELINIS